MLETPVTNPMNARNLAACRSGSACLLPFKAAPSLIGCKPAARQSQQSRTDRRCCGTASTAAEKVAATLEGESREKWDSTVARVKELGFETEKAEHIVGQAFGWGRQAYWLNKKENETPELEKVEAVVRFLEDELGIKGEDLQKVVKSFPEVIALDVEKRLKANLGHMQKAYYMKNPAAINTVKRKPEVLGYTYDCEGSCEGLCNQCWVRL